LKVASDRALDFAAVRVGDTAPEVTFPPVTITDIVRYAGASGDFTPLHHDVEYARRAGYKDVFAMGMMTAGYLTKLAGDWLGPENLRRYKVRFTGQVYPGDVLTCRGRVAAKREENGQKLLDVDLTVETQDGTVVLNGAATAEAR
jgi:acyl dehydratase